MGSWKFVHNWAMVAASPAHALVGTENPRAEFKVVTIASLIRSVDVSAP
jgi:hypothetical protein